MTKLLTGDAETLRLVDLLCAPPPLGYAARHIQVNLHARGVPVDLFVDSEREQRSAQTLVALAGKHPETLFVLPVFQRGEGEKRIDSWPFVEKVAKLAMEEHQVSNVVPFFDSSGGLGIEPDSVPGAWAFRYRMGLALPSILEHLNDLKGWGGVSTRDTRAYYYNYTMY